MSSSTWTTQYCRRSKIINQFIIFDHVLNIYCSNRKGALFRLDKEGTFEVLRGSPDLGVPQSPRVSPGGKWLVWLERDLRREKGLSSGPHTTCVRLMKLNLAGGGGPKEVIPIVRDGGKGFLGLYGNSLPRRPFSRCGRYLLLTTYRYRWERSRSWDRYL